MENPELLESLFDKKILTVLKFFLSNDGEFYLREISKKTNVSVTSTYRILNKLKRLDVIELREIKTAKLYQFGSSKQAEFLKNILEVDFVQIFIDNLRNIPGAEELLLLGQITKDKANVLILGDHVDPNEIRKLTMEIKQKYNFMINQMILTREQYQQMLSMGLYPGTKKVLWKK